MLNRIGTSLMTVLCIQHTYIFTYRPKAYTDMTGLAEDVNLNL